MLVALARLSGRVPLQTEASIIKGRFVDRLSSRGRINSLAVRSLSTKASVMAETLFEELSCIVDGANMSIGCPAQELLNKCPEIMSQAMQSRLSETNAQKLFHYGPGYGDPRFRRVLAEFLSKEYGQSVNPDSLMITAGATAGLGMMTSLFFNKGDIVFVEDLSYFLALTYFRNDCGLRIVTVPTDDDGIIPEALERAVASHAGDMREVSAQQPFRAALYLIPTFHNPTGRCLLPSRCSSVVEIARRNDLLVVCDDVYNLLPLSMESPDSAPVSPPRLFSYDNVTDPKTQGNVVSNGSFSKIFGPGVRLGWIESHARILDHICGSGFMQSAGAAQHMMSGVMSVVLEKGLQTSLLQAQREGLQEKATALCAALDRYLPPGASFQKPCGGYFVWVKLPEGVDGKKLAQRLYPENITMQPGIRFSGDGGNSNYIRLSFSYSPPDVLAKSAERFAQVVQEMVAESCSQ